MGTAQVTFVGVLCGGATVSRVTETALTGCHGSVFCACPVPPAFFSYYSSSTSTMATGSDRKSGDPFGVPFCVRMRDLKCPWGVL